MSKSLKVVFAVASCTELDGGKHVHPCGGAVGLGIGHAKYAVMVGHRQYADAKRGRFVDQLRWGVGTV